MKRVEELIIGVLLFYVVDRAARLVSSTISKNRNMTDMDTEKFRCSVELTVMFIVFLILWFRLKR
jgi:hypothetical protein